MLLSCKIYELYVNLGGGGGYTLLGILKSIVSAHRLSSMHTHPVTMVI